MIHPFTLEWRQQDPSLPRVGLVIQDKHRALTDRHTEELVAFTGMQDVRVAPKNIPHRFR
jgi:hypothetical protein